VVPNQDNDMHDGTIAQGDAWLLANLAAYYAYASDPANNSLLILTFDEDGDNTPSNQITTIFAGASATTTRPTSTSGTPTSRAPIPACPR